MQVSITHENFSIDSDNQCVIVAKHDDQEIMRVRYDFDANTEDCLHAIEVLSVKSLPHYSQAKIIYEGSLLIDAMFDPDAVDAPSEKLIQV